VTLYPFLAFTTPPFSVTSTLSLHDALPIFFDGEPHVLQLEQLLILLGERVLGLDQDADQRLFVERVERDGHGQPAHQTRSTKRRSEEHTSELQSPYDLVCRLLLEKKKRKHS